MTYSIQLAHVSKRYRIGQAPFSLRALWGRWRNPVAEQFHWAVKDLNFHLQPGEAMGIIGPNGAGKTTILKLLSKVTYPTQGDILVNGRFSALIELGAGFHPELTGRENIYLNGTILGMKRAEIKQRFDQIVEFAGIEQFLDTPVKRYSSGMYARLGFAVAAHVDSDVLLIDEVLAVGDMAFQKKCYERLLDLIQKGTTLIFVSHNLRAVQRVCSRCLVMYRGTPVFEGPTAEATAEYSNLLRRAASEMRHTSSPIGDGISQRIMTHQAVIEEVQIMRADGHSTLTFASGEVVRVRATIRFQEAASAPVFACAIRLPEGQMAYNFTTHWADIPTRDFAPNTRATIEYTLTLNLAAGTYQLGVDLAHADLSRYYDRLDRALDFVVTSDDGARGVANLHADFQVVKVETINPDEVKAEFDLSP